MLKLDSDMKKFGICHLSVAPLRLEPSDRSEIISQILFGEAFEIIEEQVKWTKIRCLWDDYEAFIDVKQYKLVDERTANHTLKSKLLLSPVSQIEHQNSHQYISIGSNIDPFLNSIYDFKLSKSEVFTVSSDKKIDVEQLAIKWLKSPYLWGGRSIFGLDCSGYVQVVFKFYGHALPRDAYQQAELGEAINFIQEAKPGDLAFFDNDEGKIIHVGIVLSDQRIIHASGEVRIDKLDHQGIFNEEIQRYTHHLRIIKRLKL